MRIGNTCGGHGDLAGVLVGSNGKHTVINGGIVAIVALNAPFHRCIGKRRRRTLAVKVIALLGATVAAAGLMLIAVISGTTGRNTTALANGLTA